MIEDIIRKFFPSLNDLNFVKAIAEIAELETVPPGETIMDFGRRIERIPMVYDGSVSVFRRDEEGHELFLYYLSPGDACAISMVCSGHDKISKIRAETIEESKFIVIPIKYMDEWMMKFKVWYYYVVETYSYRFEELLKTLDQVAFSKMDDRLHKYLHDMSSAVHNREIHITHQQIADSLFTSREVVSRLLKQMENRGMVSLDRNKIQVLFD